jgi:hypothetical protein
MADDAGLAIVAAEGVMGLNTDPELRAAVIQRAWLVAMSGAFADTDEVESRLVALGYREAARWLRDPELRQAMDRVCTASRVAFLTKAPRQVASDGAKGQVRS